MQLTKSNYLCIKDILHVSTGIYQTNNLKNIVLDEADTLLDDSFNQVTLRIIRKLKVITFGVLQLQLSHYHFDNNIPEP